MPQPALNKDLGDLFHTVSFLNKDRANAGEMAFARARRAHVNLSQKPWSASIADAVYGAVIRDRELAVPALNALLTEVTPLDNSEGRAMFRCFLASVCHFMMLNDLATKHLGIAFSYLEEFPEASGLDQVAYLYASCGDMESSEKVISFSEKLYPDFSERDNVIKAQRVISAVKASGLKIGDVRKVYSAVSELVWKYLSKRPKVNGFIDFQVNSDESRYIPIAIVSIGLDDEDRFALDDDILDLKLSEVYPDCFLGYFGILITSQHLYDSDGSA